MQFISVSLLFGALALDSARGFTVGRRPASDVGVVSKTAVHAMAEDASRRSAVESAALGAAALTAAGGVSPAASSAAEAGKWRKIDVGTSETLFDVSFDPSEPDHGMMVGAKGTFYESFDAGRSWQPRSFSALDPEEEITYRFEQVSLKDKEAYIIGKPPILLHSKDAGKSWERVPLSPKLPGEPATIVGLGQGNAEMTTSTGAIYYTSNGGLNWKAQVKETIDATLNRISSSGVKGASYFSGAIATTHRDDDGKYLAVSSRGNFYLTWEPGQDFWIPHNRGTARRIQSMNFVKNQQSNGVWMSLNGGELSLTETNPDMSSTDLIPFKKVKVNTGGYGIIDVAWKNEKEVWAVGGSGSIFISKDGGNSFGFDKSADKIPGNLYRVVFFGDNGFILGSDGVLLRYFGGKA